MKKLTKIFALTCAALAVAGCKTEIEKTVNLTDLFDKKMHLENAELNVEIPSCSNYEDSRQPSDSLLKAQNRVPQVFQHAKYKQCFEKKFKSYASFTLPVVVGNPALGATKELDQDNDSGIGIISATKEGAPLAIVTSKEFSQKVKKFIKKEMRYTDFDFNIVLNVKNDTGKAQKFKMQYAYINGKPQINDVVTMKNGGAYKLKLANVAADYLWDKNRMAGVRILKVEDAKK